MAVIAPSVSVNMSGHNNIQNQLTRSLERILEDAYLSGELKLSGRKLKDFPKAVKFNLSDTVIADLSKNRFSEIPDELTSYVYLERLLLGQNVIRNVPEAVGALQSLTYLDLSWNQLTEVPREVCQLPLEVLLLANNRLSGLPKELGRMSSLAELDAANNRIAQLPMTIGDMPSLKALNLRNNQLGLLPLQITYLRLEFLDVSCNCISSLPLELRMMASLVTLRLDHNPLVSPPTTVCMKGRVHIFKYLENLANKDLLPHKRNDDTRRSAKHTSLFMGIPGCGSNQQAVAANATIDCLRHRTRHAVDSGYSTSDGGDKRWSNDGLPDEGGGPPAVGLPVSLANLSAISCGSGRSTPSTPSTLSPGSVNLSRAQSLCSDGRLTPQNAAIGTGPRISPDGTLFNGDDKGKIGHQQTYRQYKEALRQQRQQDVYRPRAEQPSPSDMEVSGQPLNQSPVHIPKHSQSTPHSPVANGHHASLLPSSVYTRNVSSNPSLSSSGSLTPNSSQTIPNSPLLHSTPRRFQSNIPQTISYQNGKLNVNADSQYSKTDDNSQNKRPVQKVVPSRNTSKQYVSPNTLSNANSGTLTNGNLDYQNRLQGTNGGSPKLSNITQGTSNSPQDSAYIKPLSPTKSPTGTLLHGSVPPNVRSSNIPSRKDAVNGDQTNGTSGPKLLTTTVSYLKGSGPKPASNTGRLNWNKDAPPDKLSFTMKREFDKQKEESDLLQQLRVIIESKLKMSLPEDLAPVLADGVVLCHLANHVRPRSVASVHVPSPAQPKLTMARCRRNVDNFLEACRKIGVEEDVLCHPDDILQHHPEQTEEAQRDGWLHALLATVARLATHATDTHYSPPPHTALTHYDTNANDRVYDSAFFEERDELLTNETFQYEGDRDHYQISVNYFQSKQAFRNRYNDDRLVSNFNVGVNTETAIDNLTIDEVDEFELNIQNNNSEKHYMNSPDYEVGNDFVYHNPEMKLIGITNGRHDYDQPKVRYIVPLLTVPNYDDSAKLASDEVDTGYVRHRVEVYNRQNMNLDIKGNLNEIQSRDLQSLQAKCDHDRMVTWLCLGMFFLTAILLFIFPL